MNRTLSIGLTVAMSAWLTVGCVPQGDGGGDDPRPTDDGGTPPIDDGGAADGGSTDGEPDGAAPEPDAAPPEPDAAPPEPDATPPEPDAEPPELDAEPPEPDAAPPELDAEPPELDAEPPELDAALPELDAEPPELDAEPPELDAAPPEPDAEPPEPDVAPPEPDAAVDPGPPGSCDEPFDLAVGDVVLGDTTDAPNQEGGSCGADRAPEQVWRLTSPVDATVCLRTNGSDFDTLLHARAVTCDGEEIGCNDDGGEGTRSALTVQLRAEVPVFVFADGYNGFADPAAGAYRLAVLDGPCDAQPDCFEDAECRAGRICVDGGCIVPECDADRPCPDGGACVDGVCEGPPRCAGDDDCGPGTLCFAGDCLRGSCRADDACPDRELCIRNRCRSTGYQGDCVDGLPGGFVPLGSTVAARLTEDQTADTDACVDVRGADAVFGFRGDGGPVCVSTRGSDLDTVLRIHTYAFQPDPRACDRDPVVVECNDDAPRVTGGSQAAVTVDTDDGRSYFVIVDSHTGEAGDALLSVTSGECAPPPGCEGHDDCLEAHRCVEGRCQECAVDDHCLGARESCVDGECRVPPPGTAEDPYLIDGFGTYYGNIWGFSGFGGFGGLGCEPDRLDPDSAHIVDLDDYDGWFCLTAESLDSPFHPSVWVGMYRRDDIFPVPEQVACRLGRDRPIRQSVLARPGMVYRVLLKELLLPTGDYALTIEPGQCN